MNEVRLLSENIRMFAANGEQKPYVCVAFGGIAQGLGTPVFEFMKTLNSAGVSSLFIKDPAQSWYQRPIEGFGESPVSMAKTLSQLLQTHFAEKRVVAVGNSMGGFAAIAFACLCRLDSVVAFSPQTFIDAELRKKSNDARWQSEIGRISQVHIGDLKPLVAQSTAKINIYAGEQTPLDVLHARHLDSMENVHIHLLSECGHDASKWLRANGQLDRVIHAAGTA